MERKITVTIPDSVDTKLAEDTLDEIVWMIERMMRSQLLAPDLMAILDE